MKRKHSLRRVALNSRGLNNNRSAELTYYEDTWTPQNATLFRHFCFWEFIHTHSNLQTEEGLNQMKFYHKTIENKKQTLTSEIKDSFFKSDLIITNKKASWSDERTLTASASKPTIGRNSAQSLISYDATESTQTLTTYRSI